MLDALAPTWPMLPLLLPAVAFAVAGVIAARVATPEVGWRVARASTVLVLVVAAAVAVQRVVAGATAGALVRLDSMTAVMLGLVALVGWVVVRFSAVYLAGEQHQRRYASRMLLTLSAVSTVVVANHLLLLGAAWAAASLALHGLLVFFGDRPVAVAVAHKKFLLARCADACMVGAAVALGLTFDTLRLDRIADAAVAAGSLPTGARVGIGLVAVAALLKTAQLPFHGWLIQVMEAPTPVSALLHAGVVNLGGFVLLRFAPVVDRAVETRTLLVTVGVATAIVAATVMTTRVSVKVALAWSTCAQMGFMLVQCGLGLWEMALLHLTAHSLYKANAFLSAGGTVGRTSHRQLVRRPHRVPVARQVVVGAATAMLGTAAVGAVWQALPATGDLSTSVWVVLGVVALAVAPLTTPGSGYGARSWARAFALPVCYLALHELFGRLVPHGAAAPPVLLAVVAAGFVGLFVVQSACRVRPTGSFARRLRPWIYAGLFVDDAFTRLAFRWSPPPETHTRSEPLPRPDAVAVVPSASRPLIAPVPAVPARVRPRVRSGFSILNPTLLPTRSDAS